MKASGLFKKIFDRTDIFAINFEFKQVKLFKKQFGFESA